MLTPVFSAAYLRGITSVFYETTYKVRGCRATREPLLTENTQPQLRDGLIADIQGGTKETDVLKWMGRAALELVGQGTLGYSFDPLVEDSDNDFAAAVKSFLYVAAVSFRESAVLTRELQLRVKRSIGLADDRCAGTLRGQEVAALPVGKSGR